MTAHFCRTLIAALLLLATGSTQAQCDLPSTPFFCESKFLGYQIEQVVRRSHETVVQLSVLSHQASFYFITPHIYLQDADDPAQHRYYITRSEESAYYEQVHMKPYQRYVFTMHFPPLPLTTQRFHLLEAVASTPTLLPFSWRNIVPASTTSVEFLRHRFIDGSLRDFLCAYLHPNKKLVDYRFQVFEHEAQIAIRLDEEFTVFRLEFPSYPEAKLSISLVYDSQGEKPFSDREKLREALRSLRDRDPGLTTDIAWDQALRAKKPMAAVELLLQSRWMEHVSNRVSTKRYAD